MVGTADGDSLSTVGKLLGGLDGGPVGVVGFGVQTMVGSCVPSSSSSSTSSSNFLSRLL